jgi:DNA-binding transcriptional LysR family regulator
LSGRNIDFSWDHVRFFLAVVREGSLAGAGRVLGVEHSTVQRRIRELEQQLDAAIFVRTPRGYALSPLGEELLEPAEAAEAEMLRLGRVAYGADQLLRGGIRVTAMSHFADLLNTQVLASFVTAHPEIHFELRVGEELLSLTDCEADVALRPGVNKPSDPDAIARRICSLAMAPYAAPSYLSGRPRPRRMDDLGEHRLLVVSSPPFPFVVQVKERFNDNIVLETDHMDTLVSAVRAGMGVGFLPCFRGDVDASLDRLWEPELPAELWLLYHADLRRNARVRAFVDHALERLEGLTDLLEGRAAATKPP